MSITQVISVVVNSKGAVTVQKQLSAIGDSARDTTNYLNTLRAIMTSVLAFSGISKVIEVSDSFIVMQNRLKLVTDATENLGQSWTRLIGIANSSYSTIENTVDLYFRVAQAYKAWGQSAEEAYKFTDLFQKAAILSGSSMQTTSQAVYQFGQALNKGKLDGDEFRSVLEGLPYVANIIQKSLGVTRAELYKLSKEGKISVDRITQAFEQSAKIIEGDWGKITPTIMMAMNVLHNSWVDFIGEIQTGTGIFTAIAYVILAVANNFDLLAVALAPVALSIAFLAGRAGLGLVILGLTDLSKALGLATAAQWALNVAMNANPIVIVITVIVAIVAALIYFRNEIGLTNENLLYLWNLAQQTFGYLFSVMSPLTALISALVAQFGGWLQIWENIKSFAGAVLQTIIDGFIGLMGVVKSFLAYLGKAFQPVFEALMELGQAYLDLILEIASVFGDLWVKSMKAVQPAFQTLWTYLEPALKKMLQFVSDIYDGWVLIAGYLKNNIAPIVKQVFEGWIIIVTKVINFVKDLISALRTAIALMKQVTGGGGSGGGGGAKGVAAHYGAQFYAGEFASGGQFHVGGTNSGRDQTPVAFRAERGERVTVETKKQQRDNDNAPSTSVNVPVQIVNVFDPSMIPAANRTSTGQRSIVNTVKDNRDEIRNILGVA